MRLSFNLNDRPVEVETPPDRRAIDLLRDDLGALEVKEGCGSGECGACSVLIDGGLRLSCLTLAAQLAGRRVVTSLGLGSQAEPHPVHQAMVEHGAVQCGFCSPGMSVAAAALLAENPRPNRDEIRRGLAGNLCRCTGYVKIVDAVEAVARKTRRENS